MERRTFLRNGLLIGMVGLMLVLGTVSLSAQGQQELNDLLHRAITNGKNYSTD